MPCQARASVKLAREETPTSVETLAQGVFVTGDEAEGELPSLCGNKFKKNMRQLQSMTVSVAFRLQDIAYGRHKGVAQDTAPVERSFAQPRAALRLHKIHLADADAYLGHNAFEKREGYCVQPVQCGPCGALGDLHRLFQILDFMVNHAQ